MNLTRIAAILGTAALLLAMLIALLMGLLKPKKDAVTVTVTGEPTPSVTVTVTGAPTQTQEVLGEATQAEEAKQAPQASLIDCRGADGKISIVNKETCDQVSKFWASHPPAANPPATAKAADMPQSNPTPTPVLAITSVSQNFCSVGSSCYPTTRGVITNGTLFTANARVKLVDNFGNMYTGSHQSASTTQVVTDFNNLPCSKIYDVTLYFTDKADIATKSAAINTASDAYCP